MSLKDNMALSLRMTENSAKTSCGCPTGLQLNLDLRSCISSGEFSDHQNSQKKEFKYHVCLQCILKGMVS
jgi:hypothetical protein